MLHIEREINEQPDVMRRLLTEAHDPIAKITAAIRDFDPAFVTIAARGTSDNAGRYAQYLFGIEAGLSVALATPSVHTLYNATPNLSRALVIGISQSGQSEDVRRVVRDGRSQGALTMCITNDPASPLAQEAEYAIDLLAGKEKSVAATKTYTAELTAIAMLAAALVAGDEMQHALNKLPDFAAETLRLCESIDAEPYKEMVRFAGIGRGYNYATAFEISLKVKELCYIIGEEYSEADFRHGPIAVVQPGFPVLAVAPKGKTQPLMLDFLQKLHQKDACCLVISDDVTPAPCAEAMFRFAPNMPEWLTPLTAVIPGQVFAMRLALAKGYEVDKPRGLTKVTVTQ